MESDVKPIRGETDYEAALDEVARLWGAPGGTPRGDRLDVLATLIDAYETAHHPIDPPDAGGGVSAPIKLANYLPPLQATRPFVATRPASSRRRLALARRCEAGRPGRSAKSVRRSKGGQQVRRAWHTLLHPHGKHRPLILECDMIVRRSVRCREARSRLPEVDSTSAIRARTGLAAQLSEADRSRRRRRAPILRPKAPCGYAATDPGRSWKMRAAPTSAVENLKVFAHQAQTSRRSLLS